MTPSSPLFFFCSQILKYDTLTKSSLKWGEESCWPAEPLFVPAPDAEDEDDGETPGEASLVGTAEQRPRLGTSDPPS